MLLIKAVALIEIGTIGRGERGNEMDMKEINRER